MKNNAQENSLHSKRLHTKELAEQCYQLCLSYITPYNIEAPQSKPGGNSLRVLEPTGFECCQRPLFQLYKFEGGHIKSKCSEPGISNRKIPNKNPLKNQNKIFHHNYSPITTLKLYREHNAYSRYRLSRTDRRLLERAVHSIVATQLEDPEDSRSSQKKLINPVKLTSITTPRKPVYAVRKPMYTVKRIKHTLDNLTSRKVTSKLPGDSFRLSFNTNSQEYSQHQRAIHASYNNGESTSTLYMVSPKNEVRDSFKKMMKPILVPKKRVSEKKALPVTVLNLGAVNIPNKITNYMSLTTILPRPPSMPSPSTESGIGTNSPMRRKSKLSWTLPPYYSNMETPTSTTKSESNINYLHSEGLAPQNNGKPSYPWEDNNYFPSDKIRGKYNFGMESNSVMKRLLNTVNETRNKILQFSSAPKLQ